MRDRVFSLTSAAIVLLLAGCSSTNISTTSSTIRTSVETAPTDLQLLCASTAATQFGVPGGRVLPVSSRRTDSTTYLVELRLPSGTADCLIDMTGKVSSIVKT